MLVVAFELRLEGVLGVVQYQVVAAAVAAGTQFAAAQSCQRPLCRQMPRRHVGAVVDDADDNGVVHIPIQKLDHHLLPDARQAHLAEVLAGHGHHDAYPRRAGLVEFSQPVPVELQFDPAQFIGMNILSGRADDDGRLHAGIDARRAVMVTPRPPANVAANAHKGVGVFRLAVQAGGIIVARGMLDRHDEVVARTDAGFHVFARRRCFDGRTEMAFQLERAARLRRAVVAARLEILGALVALFHAAPGQHLAVTHIRVAVRAGVFVEFVAVYISLQVEGACIDQLRMRALVVETCQRQFAGAEFPHRLPVVNPVRLLGTGLGAELHQV